MSNLTTDPLKFEFLAGIRKNQEIQIFLEGEDLTVKFIRRGRTNIRIDRGKGEELVPLSSVVLPVSTP